MACSQLLAVPASNLHHVPGLKFAPQDLPVIKAYNQMDEASPAAPEPANVVIEGR